MDNYLSSHSFFLDRKPLTPYWMNIHSSIYPFFDVPPSIHSSVVAQMTDDADLLLTSLNDFEDFLLADHNEPKDFRVRPRGFDFF